MFVPGILGLIQTTCLPGLLVMRIFKAQWRLIPAILFTFGISLTATYAGVLLLTTLHLYTRPVAWAIFALEVLAAIYLYRHTLRKPIGIGAQKALAQLHALAHAFTPKQKEEETHPVAALLKTLVTIALVVYALSMLWWGVKVLFNGVGAVIDQWDAVVSWNAWAEEWAANAVPYKTWEYPQLIPINLSVSYLLMGSTEMQFFSTALMSLFTLAILLFLFDLALQHRTIGYFAAIIATKFIIKEFTGIYMNTAYVDIPLAFFSFAAVYAVLEARRQTEAEQAKPYLWIASILAGGAAVTKQGGVYILILLPVLVYFLVLPQFPQITKKQKQRLLLAPLGLSLLITLPWYIYVEAGILSGSFESNLAFVSSGIYGEQTRLEQFTAAFRSLGIYGYILILTVIGGVWLEKPYRWLVYGIVLPYYLAWAIFFSYDPRNLSLAFPFWGLAAGLLAGKLLDAGTELLSRLRLGRARAYFLPLLAAAAVIAAGFYFTDVRLMSRHDEVKRHILDNKINSLLYDYFETQGQVETVFSDYPIAELPGLSGYKISFRDQALFNIAMETNPDINYILMPNNSDQALKDQILSKVETGAYELIFEANRYYFIRVLTPE